MTDQSTQPNDDYVFYGGTPGRGRLRVLSRVMRPFTDAFLDVLAIEPDWRCLDAGCGGGDVTVGLARRVPRGHVVGVDMDSDQLRIAAEDLREAGVDNVELRAADMNSLPSALAGFDLVYVRFVLTHLPTPEHVLAAL